jgi:hypothetical protein
MTTWEAIASVPASHSDGQLTADGVTVPQVEVTIAGAAKLHVHLATIGPEGDVPEARLSAREARALAAAFEAAADAVEAVA